MVASWDFLTLLGRPGLESWLLLLIHYCVMWQLLTFQMGMIVEVALLWLCRNFFCEIGVIDEPRTTDFTASCPRFHTVPWQCPHRSVVGLGECQVSTNECSAQGRVLFLKLLSLGFLLDADLRTQKDYNSTFYSTCIIPVILAPGSQLHV